MARKSRKKRNVESNIQTVVKKENLLDTAAYIRLSVENGGNETDETLVVQQMLVERFIEEHPDLRLEEVYIDNGFTGTNFERPGFMRLMEDVRSGKVQCIVVKDLSRFGRDYIEAGRFIQKTFPAFSVRFIAITDHYDSLTADQSTTSLVIPVKNFVNDSYCQDISEKVKSHQRVKREKGKFIGAFAVYGYQKDREDKNKACYRYLCGRNCEKDFCVETGWNERSCQLRNKLNENGIFSPLE